MKKLYIFSVLFLLFASCEKAEIVQTKKESETTKPLSRRNLVQEDGAWGLIAGTNPGDEHYGCIGTSGCCVPAGSEKPVVIKTEFYVFANHFNNNQIQTYFQTIQYNTIWPNLANYPNIITGLANGSLKMIKHINTITNEQYFLAGPASSSNTAIFNAPMIVLRLPIF